MASMEPLRCVGLKQAVLSNDGSAVLLELVMINGKIFPLELQAGGVDLLARALLMAAQSMGTAQPGRAPLSAVDPATAVRVAPDAAHVRALPHGSAALLLRVGTLDLSVSIADAAALGSLLQTGR